MYKDETHNVGSCMWDNYFDQILEFSGVGDRKPPNSLQKWMFWTTQHIKMKLII